MKKKWKAVVVVFGLLFVLQIGTVVSRAEYTAGDLYYRFQIEFKGSGYTFPISGHKLVKIQYAMVTQNGNNVDAVVPTVPTNYIIIASDGRQITNNLISRDYNTYLVRYWSPEHVGVVYLRANSGSEVVGYSVWGIWNANYADIGDRCGC